MQKRTCTDNMHVCFFTCESLHCCRILSADRQLNLTYFNIMIGVCGRPIYRNNIGAVNSDKKVWRQQGFYSLPLPSDQAP
jgi:hypothetical protein